MPMSIMADSVELQISITSIKRVDPYVKEILATSTHVAFYKFNPVENEWEKTDTEGALFIYSRNGEPFHSMMIFNRLKPKNLIEPIVKDFDCHMEVPFLLYRNSKGKIYGIWFYNASECVNITYLLEQLMEGLKGKPAEKNKKKEKGVDILSMLNKAQEDFNKTPHKSEPRQLSQAQSTPRAPDVTSQSVMDFFAKASSKSAQKPVVAPVGSSEHILQRLMSNPAHSVEHIEKQQRSITPQDQASLRHQLFATQPDRRSVPITLPGPSTEQPQGEGFANFFRIESHPQRVSPLSTAVLPPHLQHPVAPEDPPELTAASPLAQLLETPQKPALMPPIMFASSVKDRAAINGPASIQSVMQPASFPLPQDAVGDVPLGVGSEKLLRNVEPLTKNQMLQALEYLLRTDDDFLVKLHQAYVKSFTDVLNQSNSGR